MDNKTSNKIIKIIRLNKETRQTKHDLVTEKCSFLYNLTHMLRMKTLFNPYVAFLFILQVQKCYQTVYHLNQKK